MDWDNEYMQSKLQRWWHNIWDEMIVEVWDNIEKETIFIDCEIIDIHNAMDRDYRIDVRTNCWRKYYRCAPECITK